VAEVHDRRRRDLAAIVAAMVPEDRGEAIRGLTSFALAARELPVVDPFGWSDASPASEAAAGG
jgi:hypothetical protein